MKHIFVVNPQAGRHDKTSYIAEQTRLATPDAELYTTRSAGDATAYVRQRIAEEGSGKGLRFYACGGDGTLNEVCSGTVGSEAEVACFPCGSGNDYIKCWPDRDFADLPRLVAGSAVEVDAMRVSVLHTDTPQQERLASARITALGTPISVNVLNFGFEAEVCRGMQCARRWPLVGGKAAYTSGIVHSLFCSRHNPCRIMVDGQLFAEGDFLLASVANGRYVGDGYCCAPRAEANDGLLEVMAIRSLSLLRFARTIGIYRKGQHLDSPQLRDVLCYCRGQHVGLQTPTEATVVVDGEVLCGSHFEIECLPKALNFVLPQNQQ